MTRKHAPTGLSSNCPSWKKKAADEDALLVFIDEAALQLTPNLHATWAPLAQTPSVEVTTGRQKVNLIGAVTEESLHLMSFDGSIRQHEVARFLRHLPDWTERKLIVIWDRASWHRCSNEIAEFLATPYGERIIAVESLPAYAPWLNAQELVWHILKGELMANHGCHTIDELNALYRRMAPKLKRRVHGHNLIEHVKNGSEISGVD